MSASLSVIVKRTLERLGTATTQQLVEALPADQLASKRHLKTQILQRLQRAGGLNRKMLRNENGKRVWVWLLPPSNKPGAKAAAEVEATEAIEDAAEDDEPAPPPPPPPASQLQRARAATRASKQALVSGDRRLRVAPRTASPLMTAAARLLHTDAGLAAPPPLQQQQQQ